MKIGARVKKTRVKEKSGKTEGNACPACQGKQK